MLTLNNIIFRVIRLPGDWLIRELWNMMIMQTAIIQCLVKWSSPGSKFRPRHRPIYQVFELIKPCNWLYCLTASWEMITACLFSCHFIFVKLMYWSRSGPCLLCVRSSRSSSKLKDLDLGYTLNSVCHPPTINKLFFGSLYFIPLITLYVILRDWPYMTNKARPPPP